MKILISYILCGLVLLTVNQKSIILIDYELNRALYEESCINKETPEMHCHGLCKLREETEKKEPTKPFVNVNFEVNMLPQKSIEIPALEIWISKDKPAFENYSEDLLTGTRHAPFNPPRSFLLA